MHLSWCTTLYTYNSMVINKMASYFWSMWHDITWLCDVARRKEPVITCSAVLSWYRYLPTGCSEGSRGLCTIQGCRSLLRKRRNTAHQPSACMFEWVWRQLRSERCSLFSLMMHSEKRCNQQFTPAQKRSFLLFTSQLPYDQYGSIS